MITSEREKAVVRIQEAIQLLEIDDKTFADTLQSGYNKRTLKELNDDELREVDKRLFLAKTKRIAKLNGWDKSPNVEPVQTSEDLHKPPVPYNDHI